MRAGNGSLFGVKKDVSMDGLEITGVFGWRGKKRAEILDILSDGFVSVISCKLNHPPSMRT